MNEKIIKQIALQFFPSCIVFLFGSRARYEHTEDSDYDLLIITNNEFSFQEKQAYKAKIRKLCSKKIIKCNV